MSSPSNKWCKECDVGVGCKIFDNVDDQCKSFRCAYNQMEKVSITMRPDNCKVIFERMTDIIFHGTLDPDYELNNNVKNQIGVFVRDGFSVIIESIGKRVQIYPAQDINSKDIYNVWKNKIKESRGCSNL
jgi:hypothetical protein